MTVEVREACTEMVDDPVYRANLAERLQAGKLRPTMEALLWHYAKGKPQDKVELGGAGAFDRMSEAELVEYIRRQLEGI